MRQNNEKLNITLIPGDGIGPEISKSFMDIMDILMPNIEWEVFSAGAQAYEENGIYLPDELFKSLEKNKIGIKGPITTPIGKGFSSVNVELRKKYDLYTNFRPVKNRGSIKTKFENVDILIFRENTEDLYAGVEEQISPTRAHSIKIITEEKSRLLVEDAFKYAEKHGKKKVTVVTKANIMKKTDGLFLDTARDVAKKYPSIELEELLVDNMCMQLVMRPEDFEIIATENLYGDILSDLCAGLVGGLGLIPGANLGKDMAIFEACHGSALDIAGQNKANPTAMLLSGALMLDYIGNSDEAKILEESIEEVLSHEENYTADLGGNCSTTDYTQKIIEEIKRRIS
ncbi:MAG: isocitrate/isopropylmalate dehydrogenase family protein [Tissierellia bacterium]|nr:isocitrate/isopropylmalate dehydrogenase family protein [Tissierellia bacterium]